jgi:raffinose/stachyose/melibiose transport system permease protein
MCEFHYPSGEIKLKRFKSTTPYLFIFPAIILVAVIVYFGIFYTFWASTREWVDIKTPSKGIGFSNYSILFQDPVLRSSLKHIFIFGAIAVTIQMTLGLIAAFLLSGNSIIGRNIHRTFIFLPVIISPAVTSISFRQLMTPDGEINSFFRFFHLSFFEQEWLSDPKVALYSLAIINIWQWTSFSFILYQASITQLEQETLEAAEIDGASSWQILTRVVAPQLRGTHITLIVMGFIGSMKTFDLPFLTTGGGPAGSTEFLTTYIFDQSVSRFHFGYGSTLSVVLCILSILFTVLLFRISREKS